MLSSPPAPLHLPSLGWLPACQSWTWKVCPCHGMSQTCVHLSGSLRTRRQREVQSGQNVEQLHRVTESSSHTWTIQVVCAENVSLKTLYQLHFINNIGNKYLSKLVWHLPSLLCVYWEHKWRDSKYLRITAAAVCRVGFNVTVRKIASSNPQNSTPSKTIYARTITVISSRKAACVCNGLVCSDVSLCGRREKVQQLHVLLGTSGGVWQYAAFNPGSGVGVLSSSGHLDIIQRNYVQELKGPTRVSNAMSINTLLFPLHNHTTQRWHFLTSTISCRQSLSKRRIQQIQVFIFTCASAFQKACVRDNLVSCPILRPLCGLTGRDTAQRGNPVVCVILRKTRMQTHTLKEIKKHISLRTAQVGSYFMFNSGLYYSESYVCLTRREGWDQLCQTRNRCRQIYSLTCKGCKSHLKSQFSMFPYWYCIQIVSFTTLVQYLC